MKTNFLANSLRALTRFSCVLGLLKENDSKLQEKFNVKFSDVSLFSYTAPI